MGAVPLRQANVAYSLYGVKKQEDGSSASSSSTGGCTTSTFINSFVTTASFLTVTNSLIAAGVEGFDAAQQDGDDAVDYDICSDEGYGVGCSSSGSLVYNLYSQNANGDYVCDKNHVAAVIDTMDDWNSDLGATGCFEIYNAAAAYTDDDNNAGGGLPVQQLLTYSQDCSIDDPEITCPDPFGVLRRYKTAFARGAYQESTAQKLHRHHVKSWIMLLVGLLFLVGSLYTIFDEVRFQRMRERRAGMFARQLEQQSTNAASTSDGSDGTATTSSSESELQPRMPVPKAPPARKSILGRFFRRNRRKNAAVAETELPALERVRACETSQAAEVAQNHEEVFSEIHNESFPERAPATCASACARRACAKSLCLPRSDRSSERGLSSSSGAGDVVPWFKLEERREPRNMFK